MLKYLALQKIWKDSTENSGVFFSQLSFMSASYLTWYVIKVKTLTLVQSHYLDYRLYSDFTSFSTNVLSRISSGIDIPSLGNWTGGNLIT